ncbi:MAG TPA: hypothetical protein VMF69_20530 [Gemmataceae bacterium]|nr:hypothetical protein [Gemmataceae bacterium]
MVIPGSFSLDAMERAVGKVYERLLRATAALERAGIAYAVAGGHAVAAWVARVDESATRNTRDVDLLIRRADLEAAKNALETAGFFYRHSAGVDLFLDGPEAKARDAVHIVFAGEKVRPHEPLPNPDVTDSELADRFRVLSLPALVRVKLTAFRDKDRTHLRDLLEVGLIDTAWTAQLPPELAARLQTLIDTPEG